MAIALIASFVLAAVAMFAIGAHLVTRSPGPDVSAIAVVPFSDLTQTAPSFGARFASQLAELVSKAPGLRLVEQPRAATLIEGSARTSGERVRVSVWLVRAYDRRALWSGAYEFNAKEAAAAQNEIARSVAKALHLQPSSSAHE